MRYFEKALLVILPLLVMFSGIGCDGGTQTGAGLTISNVTASNISATSATISWVTNQSSHSEVYFGTFLSGQDRRVVSDQELVPNHSIILSELKSNQTYYFDVFSKDAVGNKAVSTGNRFVTLAPSSQSDDTKDIREAVQSYLTYEKSKQWDNTWSMLHPDSQALFSSKDEFIQQEEKDNAEGSLKSFSIVDIGIIPQWTFASEATFVGTNKTYSNVAEIQVILVYPAEPTSPEPQDGEPKVQEPKDKQLYVKMRSINYGGKWRFLLSKPGATQPTDTRKIIIKYSSDIARQVSYFTAIKGYTYLTLTLDIQNQGYDSFGVKPSLFKVIINSVKYSSKPIALKGVLEPANLANGGNVKGKITFEVPENVTTLGYQFVYEGSYSYTIEWIKQ